MSDIKKLLEDFSRIESSTTRNSENLNEFGFLSKLQKSLEKRSPYQPTQQQDPTSWQPNQQQLAWLNKGGATNVDLFDPAIIARMPARLGDKPPLQYYRPEDQKYAQQTAFIPQAIKDLTTPVDLNTRLRPDERADADKALQRVLKSQQQQQLPTGMEPSLEESGLQAYLGNKKYGKKGMDALRKAGRDGASKEKMAKIRAKYDKLDEEGVAEGFSDVVKGVNRSIKGKEHPDVVASKHAGRAIGHYNQGDIAAGDKETERYKKIRNMHLKAKGVAEGKTHRSAADRLTRKFENYLSNRLEMLEGSYGSEKKKFKVEAAPSYPNAQDPNAQTTSPQPPTAPATKDERDEKREQQVDIATAKATMSGLKNVLGPNLDINQAASAVTKINDRKPLTGPEQQAMSAITPLLAKAAEMPQTASNLKTSLTNAAYLAKLGK